MNPQKKKCPANLVCVCLCVCDNKMQIVFPISAPWSNLNENAAANPSNSALTMAEIQKAERERRSEMFRLEQANQQSQAMLEQQQQKDSPLKWKLKPQANLAKSLAEIQAEESKARTIQQLSAASVSEMEILIAKNQKKNVKNVKSK